MCRFLYSTSLHYCLSTTNDSRTDWCGFFACLSCLESAQMTTIPIINRRAICSTLTIWENQNTHTKAWFTLYNLAWPKKSQGHQRYYNILFRIFDKVEAYYTSAGTINSKFLYSWVMQIVNWPIKRRVNFHPFQLHSWRTLIIICVFKQSHNDKDNTWSLWNISHSQRYSKRLMVSFP